MDDVPEDPDLVDLSSFYDPNVSQEGSTKTLVLDGQQRLQSLFSAYAGSFYGKDLYIDITSGDTEVENGISYRFDLSGVTLELPFYKVKSLTNDRRSSEEIADDINDKLSTELTPEMQETRSSRERKVRHNISQLASILREDKHLWIEELDGMSSDAWPYKAILNVFIRVNSGGTRLNAGDLVFAAMKEEWADVEQNVEAVVDSLNRSGKLEFSKDFVLRALTLASGKGAVLKPEMFLGADGDANLDLLEDNWTKAEDAFNQLIDFIYTGLQIYSDKVIRSYNAFIPVFEYFFLHRSPSPEDRELLKSYYYKSQLFNWYSARTDQLLEAVHTILSDNKSTSAFPLAAVDDYFRRQGKQTHLSIENLHETRLRFILLNQLYVENIGVGAFDVKYKGNEPHVDHIYPKSKLRSLPANEVNNIGNYRFVGASDNIRKRAEDASSYFCRLKAAGVDIKRHLLITEFSDDPRLLVESNYARFRDQRLQRIYEICARIVNQRESTAVASKPA